MIGEIIANEAKEVSKPLLENYKSINPEGKITDTEADNFWKSEFGTAADDPKKNESLEREIDANPTEIKKGTDGYYTTREHREKNTNLDNSKGGQRGTWTGERADSTFIPSYDYMKDTLKEYGLRGIEYVNGEADFSRVADATVKIDNMTAERYGKGNNFDQANSKLAKQFNEIKKSGRDNWTAADVEDYRLSNKLTWHERCDCKTMDLVPTKIHDYFKHSGGVAECKARDGIGGRFDE